MNKITKNYTIIWAVMLVVFNIIVFAAPGWNGLVKYTGAFWVAYIVTTIVFVAHLLLTLWAFKDAECNTQRLFYNIPIIRISYTALVVTIIAAALTMLNSLLPTWAAIVVMLALAVFYAITIAKTKMAIDVIEEKDQQIKEQTSTIKDLRAQAASITTNKELAAKIAEALRFSDPVSNPNTTAIEEQLKQTLNHFKDETDPAKAAEIANAFLSLLEERNVKCKVGK